MYLVVYTQWHQSLTEKLAEGAESFFRSKDQEVLKIDVPGALEIALAVKWKWERQQKSILQLQGVVACGCVIRGETHHFEVVANESARALTDLSLNLSLPIGNAILTVNNVDQADARARSGRLGNKGYEAAEAVYAMTQLKESFSQEVST